MLFPVVRFKIHCSGCGIIGVTTEGGCFQSLFESAHLALDIEVDAGDCYSFSDFIENYRGFHAGTVDDNPLTQFYGRVGKDKLDRSVFRMIRILDDQGGLNAVSEVTHNRIARSEVDVAFEDEVKGRHA